MPTPITATTIAKIANVSLTAVGQWRKNDNTFPEPLDPTSRPATFDQDRVIGWLKSNNKTIRRDAEQPTTVAISAALDQLRGNFDTAEFSTLLFLFAARRHLDTITPTPTVPEPLASRLTTLFDDASVAKVYAQLSSHDAHDILEHGIRYSRNAGRSGAAFATTEVVNNLLSDLAPDTASSILDFACGSGGTLAALQRRFPAAHLSGNDINPDALMLAQARAVVEGWEATWSATDAIAANALPADSADLVCIVPPWNMRFPAEELSEQPQRWRYGTPNRTDDTVWLQLAHNVLTDNGTAIAILSPSTLNRPETRQKVLNKMVADGSLQAVIGLPDHLHPGTAIPTVAIVLTKNPSHPTDTVLFARIHDEHVTRTRGRQVTKIDTTSITAALQEHRSHHIVPTTSESTQVTRLDLIGADKTYNPDYWVTQANLPTADQLQTQLDAATTAITPLDGLGNEIDHLDIGSSRADTISARQLPGVTSVRRQSDREDPDAGLRSGDVCVGQRRASICETDGVRPDGGYMEAYRCDPEQTDPWFLAAVITAAIDEGAASAGSTLRRVDLRLVNAPNISLEDQRALGAVYQQTLARQQQAEQQATAWSTLSTQVAISIASGLAHTTTNSR